MNEKPPIGESEHVPLYFDVLFAGCPKKELEEVVVREDEKR